jgi:hypothetical protein
MALERPRGIRWGWQVKEDVDRIGAHGMFNAMVAEVRAKADPEWYFLIADDMIVPPDAAVRLLEHGEKIDCGVYALRRYGETACLIPAGMKAAKLDWKPGDRFYGYAPCSCMLIHRDVFDGMRSPWFEDPAETDMDEGLKFCRKAEELGFKCLIDTNIQCGHVVREGIENVAPRRVIWTRQALGRVG